MNQHIIYYSADGFGHCCVLTSPTLLGAVPSDCNCVLFMPLSPAFTLLILRGLKTIFWKLKLSSFLSFRSYTFLQRELLWDSHLADRPSSEALIDLNNYLRETEVTQRGNSMLVCLSLLLDTWKSE